MYVQINNKNNTRLKNINIKKLLYITYAKLLDTNGKKKKEKSTHFIAIVKSSHFLSTVLFALTISVVNKALYCKVSNEINRV